MMWLFQRIVFGRAPGELPDAQDGELTQDEIALLETAGAHDHGHLAHAPVSGGSQDHVPYDPEIRDEHEGQEHVPDLVPEEDPEAHGPGSIWPDLSRKELLTLAPLAALTIFFGVYPKPIFDILEPSLTRILQPFLS